MMEEFTKNFLYVSGGIILGYIYGHWWYWHFFDKDNRYFWSGKKK